MLAHVEFRDDTDALLPMHQDYAMSRIHRRSFTQHLTRTAVGLALSCGLTTAAWSQQAFPNKPIKILVGFPAGGPLDAHARLMVERLQTILGQTVIVDYKAGAGGTVGADFVAKSAPDGYTLLLANTGTMVINEALYAKPLYRTLKDFVPVARTAQQPLAMIVHPSVPANTLGEFISLVRKSPGQFNYGSAGNGGISHLVPEMLKSSTGTFMLHIPYRGSAPAFTDLIAGQVQFMAESVPQAAQYAKQGRVRALAVTGRERSTALPDVPTMKEAGIPNFEVVGFYGILAPAGTPKDVVAKLADAFKQTLETPDVRSKMITQGADPAFLGPDAFVAYLQAEMPRWAEAVKRSGARVD
jgi:tripartite-type tricarboxylate transporter receptor subunit TctC